MNEHQTPPANKDGRPTGLSVSTGSVCFVDCGGPTRKISVNGEIVTFEDHPYCGPTKLNKRGDPAREQPIAFLKAASLWAQQGRQMKDGLCAWNHEQEPILRQINRRNAVVIGWKPARKGE
jgi:hypothetical protein